MLDRRLADVVASSSDTVYLYSILCNCYIHKISISHVNKISLCSQEM
jgi:hypothetical protein